MPHVRFLVPSSYYLSLDAVTLLSFHQSFYNRHSPIHRIHAFWIQADKLSDMPRPVTTKRQCQRPECLNKVASFPALVK